MKFTASMLMGAFALLCFQSAPAKVSVRNLHGVELKSEEAGSSTRSTIVFWSRSPKKPLLRIAGYESYLQLQDTPDGVEFEVAGPTELFDPWLKIPFKRVRISCGNTKCEVSEACTLQKPLSIFPTIHEYLAELKKNQFFLEKWARERLLLALYIQALGGDDDAYALLVNRQEISKLFGVDVAGKLDERRSLATTTDFSGSSFGDSLNFHETPSYLEDLQFSKANCPRARPSASQGGVKSIGKPIAPETGIAVEIGNGIFPLFRRASKGWERWDPVTPESYVKSGSNEDATVVASFSNISYYRDPLTKPTIFTATYDGKNVGQRWSLPVFYLSDIDRQMSLVVIENKSNGKGGSFLSTNGAFQDPERWKPLKINDQQLNAAKKKFQELHPNDIKCVGVAGSDFSNAHPLPTPIPITLIKKIKAYGSKNGDALVGLQYAKSCMTGVSYNSSQIEPLFRDHWILVRSDLTTRLVSSIYQPIDAADIDGDGKSEWLFKDGHTDRYLYQLFYMNFEKNCCGENE